MPRRTLASDATVEGVGLHTGARVTARCLAAEPGRGIVFRRVDLPGAPEVPARLSHVRSTERRTALGEAPGTVETVEHLLAAAAALQLDDLVVASFVTGPGASTLPMVIFSKVRLGVSPDINALATIIIAIVAIGVFIASWQMRRAARNG